jgi:hypothetical protein
MRAALLITLYAVWPVAAVVATVIGRVRGRFLLACAGTWVLALAIGTTATPVHIAVPVGLAVGATGCLFMAFVVNEGATLMWSDTPILPPDQGKMLRAELVVLGVVALVDAAAIALAVTG